MYKITIGLNNITLKNSSPDQSSSSTTNEYSHQLMSLMKTFENGNLSSNAFICTYLINVIWMRIIL